MCLFTQTHHEIIYYYRLKDSACPERPKIRLKKIVAKSLKPFGNQFTLPRQNVLKRNGKEKDVKSKSELRKLKIPTDNVNLRNVNFAVNGKRLLPR